MSFGGGFGHFSEDKSLICYGANLGGSSSGVLQGGVGLDVSHFGGRLRHFGIRGPARLICPSRTLAKLARTIIFSEGA